jgi:AcrR family transcriptional regulator
MGQSRPPSVTPSADRPISARRAATRERLLAAAKHAFAERGINGAAVEDICEAAGFTRGAFYSNFAGKKELLVTLLGSEHEMLMGRVNAALEQHLEGTGGEPDSIDVVDQIVERFLAASPLDRESLLLQGEFQQLALRDPWAARVLVQKDDAIQAELATLIMSVLARAGRRLVVDVEDVMRTVKAVFQAAIIDVHLREGEEPVDTAPFRRSIRLIVQAFSAPADPSADQTLHG